MRSLSFFLIASLVLLFCGCASSGTKMDSAKVQQIQKNVTTRAEIEACFGVPNGPPVMLPDGRRQVMYAYSKRHGDVLYNLPYVSLVAGGVVTHDQYLQITYKDNIVEDFEYTDINGHSEGGAFNQHGASTSAGSAQGQN